MNWLSATLKDIATDIQSGFAKQPDEIGLPQLRTNNVSSDGRIDLSLVKTVEPSPTQLKNYSLKKGDILFNNTNSPALVGKTALFDEEGLYLFSNHMTRIRLNDEIANSRFVAHYLHRVWRTGGFRALVTQWVNQAAINRSLLEKIEIPLPPPKEQRRIVEILDQADELRHKRAEADRKAERILPALFIKMFGDPATNPKNLKIKSLGELAEEFRYGTSAKCESNGLGLPVLRISNIVRGELDLTDLKYAELNPNEINTLKLIHGDILFVRTNGNPDYVGRCSVFDKENPMLFASYLIRARVKTNLINPWFITSYLQTLNGRQAMSPFIRTTAGQSNINIDGLKQIPIPLPEIEIQEQFINHFFRIRKVKKETQKSEKMISSLFSNLLQRAFSSELTAKWREAHLKELLAEMEIQRRELDLSDSKAAKLF